LVVLNTCFCLAVNVLCIADWSWQNNDWLQRSYV